MPRVSVVMPVFNGELYLAEAIESVLSQTYRDFEFLIIDDGSTDSTASLIAGYQDPRIRIIRNQQNLGLIRSLNLGFELASGEYIARMDADDVCLPKRLEKQVNYLDAHPEVGVVGSYMIGFGERSGPIRFPSTHTDILVSALFDSPIAHPTVAFRQSILEKPALDPEYPHAEDYDLWSRLLRKGIRFHVLRNYLLKYRVHPTQVSSAYRHLQIVTADRIRARWMAHLGMRSDKASQETHRMIAHSSFSGYEGGLAKIRNHLEETLQANRLSHACDERALELFVGQKWLEAVIALARSESSLESIIQGPGVGVNLVFRRIFWKAIYFNLIYRLSSTGSRAHD